MIKQQASPWRKFYTRKLLHDNNIRFREGAYYFEDFVFSWAIFVHAQKVAFVSESLLDYRTGRNNQTTNLFYEFDKRKENNNALLEKKGIKERLAENVKSMMAAKIIVLLPLLNHATLLVKTCPSKYNHCELLRRQFLFSLNMTSYVSNILHLDRNPKLINKTSAYNRMIARCRNLMDGDAAASNASVSIPKPDILLSIVIRTENVKELLGSIERNLDQLSVRG